MCDEASKSPTVSNRSGGGQMGDKSEKGKEKEVRTLKGSQS